MTLSSDDRFGMGRSATVALALLVAVEGWEIHEAMTLLKAKRPEVTTGVMATVVTWLRKRG